jgi:hypothetical protein
MTRILQATGSTILFLLLCATAGAQTRGENFPRPMPAPREVIRTVPGLGFDYPHLAAISGNSGGVTSFETGFRGSEGEGFITPVFLGGYPYEYPPAPQEPQVIVIQQPSPVIVVQQPAPISPAPATPSKDNAVPPPPAANTAPVQDVSAFVLIRRDGKLLFASAYSVIGKNLRYITPEGIRRTLPLAELDADATRQMNEARGTTFQL